MHNLKIGIKGYQEITVTNNMTAKIVESGEENVFATPCLISLAEKTAWLSVKPFITDEETTVGSLVNISHLAPTPVGMNVKCETVLSEIDRRKLVFDVVAYDEKGKIAEGKHERFVVNRQKFLEKCN